MKHFLLTLLILLPLAACDTGSQRPIETPAIQQEMDRRQIRHIKEGDVAATALEEGKRLADTAQAALMQKLQAAITEKRVAGAVTYCQAAALPLLDSLSPEGVSISRSSLRLRNPANAPSPLEYQLLDAYRYSAENGETLQDNLQPLGDTAYLYTRPILMQQALCLNCHGKPVENISPETQVEIQKRYPADSATHYKLGDFRGMWRIHLPKKYVIKQLN